MKNLAILIFIYLFSSASLLSNVDDDTSFDSSSGEITGKITQSNSNIPLSQALVIIQSGAFYLDVETDETGWFALKPIPGGKYSITVIKDGYQKRIITDITLQPDQQKHINISLSLSSIDLPTVEVVTYVVPLMEVTSTAVMATLTSEEFDKMPTRKIADAIEAISTGVYKNREGIIQVRGARAGTTAYIVDGMRVSSLDGIPSIAIDQMQIITGGIPAKYGDTTGGVIIVNTKSFYSK